MAGILLRFKDLKERRIIDNHGTLEERIKRDGFPVGRWLGPNTRVWSEDEVTHWLDSRPTERPPRRRRVRQLDVGL